MSDATNSTPSDRDVLEGTGRHPDEWFAFLDMAGAAKWQHEEFVAWFEANASHVNAEWVEGVTARYAAVRGLTISK